MKIPRVVVYIVFGFVVSSLLHFFFGSGGLRDYSRLSAYRGRIQQNVTDLQQRNAELLAEVEALGSDPERLMLQARELGYYREGEKVIRIAGYRPGRNHYTVGKILRRKPKKPRADWPFRLIGVGLPVVLLLVSAMVRRRKNREAGNR